MITPDEGDPTDVELTGLPTSASTLRGSAIAVFTCLADDCLENLDQLAVADSNGNFLFDPVLDPTLGQDPAAEVNVYYHLERFLNLFSDLGLEPLDAVVNVIVDYGWDEDGDGKVDDFFAGATDVWGSPGLLIGHVGDRRLAYDPDVLGHEITHIATGETHPIEVTLVSTGLNGAAGALIEGTADFFSCSFMDDPDMGEYTAQAIGAPYLSSVDNAAVCPGSLVGQAHMDGQIWSGILWDIRSLIGAQLVNQAVFDGLKNVPTGFSMTDAIMFVRNELVPAIDSEQLADVDDAIASRGLTDCNPIFNLGDGQDHEIWLPSRFEEVWDESSSDLLGLSEYPAPIQIAVDIPAAATEVTLSVLLFEDDEIDPSDLEVHVRLGEPVAYSASQGQLLVSSDGSYPSPVQVILDDSSVPAIQTGTVFFSFVHSGSSDGFIEIDVEIL